MDGKGTGDLDEEAMWDTDRRIDEDVADIEDILDEDEHTLEDIDNDELSDEEEDALPISQRTRSRVRKG